jgi:pantoate--beta-alanine ligase|tara:strand:+ start:1459 stop:2310 length:852 start_codon:yes stop_codon:yes gene_type:complete
MQVIKTKTGLIAHVNKQKQADFSVGFVPTMGALHEGHLSLVKAALASNKCVVVSIFVNPTQFNNLDDLNKYPRTLDKDIELLETLSKQSIVVYAPEIEDVYGPKIAADSFDFEGLELEMEGRSRPGHFDGVGTIVKRLFEIVNPDNAYFGEKDFQQLQIIKKMVAITKLPVKIIGCPIEREPNGLAMSSRNTRLNSLEQDESALIYKTLKLVKQKFKTESVQAICRWVDTQFSAHQLFELEYFQISEIETLAAIEQNNSNKTYRAFIAVLVRDIRLIDNIDLN